MKLSGESDVETMRGNEISTADKVHWYLSGFRSDRKRTREATKIQTAQKKQGRETMHSECLKLKHEPGYLGNREEFYWRNAVGATGMQQTKRTKYCPKADGKKLLTPNPLDDLLSFATNKYERALRRSGIKVPFKFVYLILLNSR